MHPPRVRSIVIKYDNAPQNINNFVPASMQRTRNVSISSWQLLHDIRFLDVRRWYSARTCDCHRSQGLRPGSRGTHRFDTNEEISLLPAGKVCLSCGLIGVTSSGSSTYTGSSCHTPGWFPLHQHCAVHG